MFFVRHVGSGALLLASVCWGCHAEPGDVPEMPAPDAGSSERPLLTPETLGGSLLTPDDASVTWARTFPGYATVPPEVRLGPNGDLIAEVTIERRPAAQNRYVADASLMRLDASSGDVSWIQPLASEGLFELDGHGNILLPGLTELTKLDPDGGMLWSKTLSLTHAYPRLAIAVDGSDNILVLEQDLDSAAPNVSDDVTGLLRLEKLDPEGQTLWSKQIGAGELPFDGAYVAVDGGGNVLVLASLVRSGVDFGGGPLSGDAVLAKYDRDGNYLFGKVLALGGPITYPVRKPVLADASGNIFVTSPSFGPVDIGLGSIFCVGDYVLKFDATGIPLWNACAMAGDLTLTADGGYVTSGPIEYDQRVGGRQCTVLDRDAEGSEGALARFDAAGTWVATACAADTGYQYFGNVAPDASGALIMTGAFTLAVTLPDGIAVPAVDGEWTAMIAKVHLEP